MVVLDILIKTHRRTYALLRLAITNSIGSVPDGKDPMDIE